MRLLLAAAALLVGAPAAAQAQRDLCPDRPGLSSPACTVEPGSVMVETALADWERGSDADTWLFGDTLVRLGLDASSEIAVGWTPFGHVRERGASGRRADRVGDVTLEYKRNLRNPDGHGFAIAVEPIVTLPVGRTPVGAGTWSAGLMVPMTYDLSDALQFELMPEIDAAANENGAGRHLAYGSVIGLEYDVADAWELVGEVQWRRDDDPVEPSRQAVAGLAVAWQPSDVVQFDIGSVFGLTGGAPAARLYAGVARHF